MHINKFWKRKLVRSSYNFASLFADDLMIFATEKSYLKKLA